MSSALQAYALCVVVLFLKMFLVSCYQGYHRLRFVAFTNPEDAAVFGRVAQAAERPQVIRAAKVWANDLENIPLFFALGGKVVWSVGFCMALGQFIGARFGSKLVLKKGVKLIKPLLVTVSLVMSAKLVWSQYPELFSWLV